CLFTLVLCVATAINGATLYAAPLQQNITVTGLVTSASDQAGLPGVSIVLKGTTIGTVTDVNGRYRIDVPAEATLVFSFVGFESQEIAVGERTTIDVVMQ